LNVLNGLTGALKGMSMKPYKKMILTIFLILIFVPIAIYEFGILKIIKKIKDFRK
jgi:hypothetical protein